MYIHERTPELEQLSYMHFINEDIPKQEYIDRKAGKYRVSPEKRIKYSGNIWLEAAKEFIGETNYMKNVVKVMYDDFVYSQEYRKHICEQVNGTYNESMLNIVPEAGNYSTFDGDAYQNRGSKMKVLERYKKWERIDSHLLILSFLKDSEALKFYIDNFELNDDKKRFIDEWLT
jgi:hypothetical protein